MKKRLLYSCPGCSRSFHTKEKFILHLKRNKSEYFIPKVEEYKNAEALDVPS